MTSTSVSPYLPCEILHKIIDHLADDCFIDDIDLHQSQAALRQCSLVCRFFAERSRRHLFRYVDERFTFEGEDEIPKKKKALANLADILNPCQPLCGVAPYVQGCSLSLSFTRANLYKDLQKRYLCPVFDAFHSETYGVNGFTLIFNGLVTISWTALEPSLRASIYRFCHSPYLNYLHIRGLYHIPLDLITNPNLTELHIDHLCHQSNEFKCFPSPQNATDSRDIATIFSKVHTLTTDFSFPFFRILNPSAGPDAPTYPLNNLRSLRSADFSRLTYGQAQIQVLLRQNPHLERLDLHGYSSKRIDPPWDLTQCPKLKWLGLSITSHGDHTTGCLPIALRLLNHPSPHPNLSTLILGIAIVDGKRELLDPSANHHWEQLNDMLAGGRFPNLQLLRLRLYDEVRWNSSVPLTLPWVREAAGTLIRRPLRWVEQEAQRGLVFQLEFDSQYLGMN